MIVWVSDRGDYSKISTMQKRDRPGLTGDANRS